MRVSPPTLIRLRVCAAGRRSGMQSASRPSGLFLRRKENTMRSIKAGDCVELKSGGPLMTVAKIKDLEVTCVWFANGGLEEEVFPLVTLKASTPRGTR
jgi:uncharacterized protein YodC (DUF2158 family)